MGGIPEAVRRVRRVKDSEAAEVQNKGEKDKGMTVMEKAREQQRLKRHSKRQTAVIRAMANYFKAYNPKKWRLDLFWLEQRKAR